jgi:adenylate cyclase
MAFWGAPLPDEAHARNAVMCAIAMRKRCSELRGLCYHRYGKNIEVRAGVNTVTAVAGNMGSKHKYNYTAMGDTVNLASRLEGANKAYGTELMIAEATLRQIGDAVDVRELDLLAVKGKQLPVRVYEVLDVKGQTDAGLLDAASRFATGLVAYRGADFVRAGEAFEAVLKVRPDDGPALAYIERCRELSEAPPPRDWDGVYRMETK